MAFNTALPQDSEPAELITDQKDRKFVTALARGLEILRAFNPDDRFLGNREISRRTNIPPSTVSRLTYTLTKLGYLRHDGGIDKYSLDIGTLALGYRRLAEDRVSAIARPYLQAFSEATGCFVGLAVADGLDMVYVEVFQGRGPLVLRVETGSRASMVQAGKGYLAALPEPQRSQLIRRIQANSDPANWVKTHARFERALVQYREQGFCSSAGDWEPEISGASAPLVLNDGQEILDFHCGGLTRHLDEDALKRNIGPRLVALVRRVREDLGQAAAAP
jgi:DNA-binding IclR family transcriptional regulator